MNWDFWSRFSLHRRATQAAEKPKPQIAARHEAEDALRQSDARFRRLVESNLVGVIIFDLSGVILDCNDAFLQTIGYGREDLAAGKIDWQAMTPAGYARRDARAIKELETTGRHGAIEKQYFRKDGSLADVLVASALFDADATQGIGVVVDISDRKRAEANLRAGEARKTAILQSALDCVIGIDHATRIIEWNPAAEKTFGYMRAEAIGQLLPELIIPSALRALHYAGMAKYLALGEGTILNQRVEVLALRRDGTEFPVELAITRIAMEGEPLFIAYLRDITERRQTESDLQRARDVAEAANQTKSLFLANMSHELRTPLNAILGYSEMLLEDASHDKPEITADLQKVYSAGKHLLSLVNDILDLSKIEAGKMEIFVEEFEVCEVIEELVATVAPLIEKNYNTLCVECASDLGEMRSDLTKFRQCVLNLLSNAAKFTQGGEIGILARREKINDADWICLKVTDTGIGLNTEEIMKLFRPFMQADASTTRKFGGTGLGLALTRRFCRMLGGDVSVESTPGAGSTFTIHIPAQLPHAPALLITGESHGDLLEQVPESTAFCLDDNALHPENFPN